MEEQIVAIEESIGELEDVRSALEGFKTTLESEADVLRKHLEDNAEADYETKKALEDSIQFIESQIDTLKVKDKALDEQIVRLQEYVDGELATKDWTEVTFLTLEQYDETLKELLSINDNLKSIEALVKKNEDDISAINESIVAIEAAEESMKSWVNETLAEGYNGIATIESKLEALEAKLSEADDEAKDLKDQIKAQQAALKTAKEELTKAYEQAISTAIEENKGVIYDKIAKDIETANEYVDTEIGKINEEIGKLDERITAMEEKVENHDGRIQTVEEQIDSIKVSIGELEENINHLEERLSSLEGQQGSSSPSPSDPEDVSALQEEINKLNGYIRDLEGRIKALEDAKEELIKAYEQAISEAIDENNDVIDGKIDASVKEVNENLQSIRNEVKDLRAEIEELRSQIESGMVQSVVYMPEYSDGAAYVGIFSRTLEMSFKLSPSSVVASLKEVWESSLSVKFLTTKSTKAAPVMKDLSIKSAEFDETIGTVTVTVDCSNLAQSFYTGETSASASLFISDGHSNVSSDFVPLVLNEDETIDVPSLEAANCYIVSESGWYQFRSAKGNSLELLSDVESAEVLWESFGTDVTPEEGDLVSAALYRDGNIYFKTADTFKEGNAVIAAKDASGKILWSWHIWLTDQPEEQVYYNNAGTMMDRNLGATSATPGDVGALGLLYQWGRKDPFLGSSSISSDIEAKSTGTWPSAVSSNSTNGTIEYATAYPTTFIKSNSSNHDWYYTGSSATDNTRWTTSARTKSIYDPCPSGWRVPDGGENGIWSKARGSSSSFTQSSLYDSTNECMNFSGKFGSASTIWYPASGCRISNDGGLDGVGSRGRFWSASPFIYDAYYLGFGSNGYVSPSSTIGRAYGHSVRCIKEGTGDGSSDSGNSSISTSSAVSLTTAGTSNSYIVSQKGTYSFPTVKGNSSASVGSVESAEVLWESFGTDVTPEEGDLVSAALYRDGNIYFKTADTFKEGNAVIAAKDASGTILWSWHIWLTDQPKEQVYKNNAGTMMDRNLGATSATPGDVGALGLLYQWGRKDPFLGSSSISSDIEAKSTGIWPSAVSSNSTNGTIEYATAYPTTFIKYNSSNYDWYYTGSSTNDNTRWTTSETAKSIYDPCPAGWRVPDGGSNGIWSKAGFDDTTYDSTNKGISFSISSPSTTWYPASSIRGQDGGGLGAVGYSGYYWSASTNSITAYCLSFGNGGSVSPSGHVGHAGGLSVRCIRE